MCVCVCVCVCERERERERRLQVRYFFQLLVTYKYLESIGQGRATQVLVCFLFAERPNNRQSVSHGQICSHSCISTCCHTEIVAEDQTCCLTQSTYTDTGQTSPSADSRMPDVSQDGH